MNLRMCIGLLGTTAAAILLSGCAPGHGSYTTEGINLAQERMATIKSGTEWDMARQQFLVGDLNKALRSVDRSISINNSVAKSHNLRGRILVELGQLEGAIDSFRRAIEIDPAFVEAHYYLGVIFERFNETEQALERYQAASALDSSNPQYTLAAAEMLIESGRLSKAEELLRHGRSRFEHNAGVRQTLGHIAMMRGDSDQAADLFSEARLLDPEDRSIMEDLVIAQMAAGRHGEAEYTLRQLLKDREASGRRDLQQLHARCLVELDRPVEARAILLAITGDDKGASDVDAWIDLAKVALILGDYQRVRIAAGRITAIAPQRYEGHMLAGMWQRHRGELERALSSLDRAVTYAADSPDPALLRGMVLRELGRYGEAEESFLHALAIAPTDARAKSLLSTVQASADASNIE